MLRSTALAYIVRMDINRTLDGKMTHSDRIATADLTETLDIDLTVARAIDARRIPRQTGRNDHHA